MDTRILRAVAADGIAAHIKDVFLSCYDEIIARRITTVSQLVEYIDELPWHPGLEKVIRKAFGLVRELNWGVFRELDKQRYPKLWDSLVLPNRQFPETGDLKRNLQVPNIYCAVMDIHAYTDFCRKYRHNFSMLNMLDEIIQQDIRDIAQKNQCLSSRSAGDNILVIGTSPSDIIHACLGIVDCFSRRRVIKNSKIAEQRRGTSIILQDINVTAGIAGGQRYSSLVVTADGDVSGSIVNTASRLQDFANHLAPEHSKVLVTSQVFSGYLRDQRVSGRKSDGIEFFWCGRVQFKGGGVPVHEVLFVESDFKKLRYQKEYRRLVQTMLRGGWKDRLVTDAIDLVIQVLKTVPQTRLEVLFDDNTKIYNTSTIISLAEHALETYRSEQDHRQMCARLQKLLAVVELVRGFDRLVLLHLRQIVLLFDRLTLEYEAVQYQKILENESDLFSHEERKVIANAERLEQAKTRLIEQRKADNKIYSAPILWSRVIQETEKNWEFRIYSGKR
jgi:class 3 adenylate cyclase